MMGAGRHMAGTQDLWDRDTSWLYLHVCHVVLAPVEDDITDLAAVVQHRVQHVRGILAMELPKLQHLLGMLGSSPVKSVIQY